MLFRGKQLVGQLAVICNKKQSFRIFIKAPYWKKIPPAILWNQLQNRLLPGILCGAHIPGWLMQKIVHKLCPCPKALSAQLHHIVLRVHLQFRLFHLLTIYLNHSLLDQLLHICSRAGS